MADLDPAVQQAAKARVERLLKQAAEPTLFGAWTLFRKEILRFWGVAGQTIVSPVITTMLYFLVFGYSLGDRLKTIQGVPYVDFLVPGLVLLAMVSNAFLNSAFSMFIAKVHGTLIDILVTPLSYLELLAAYTAASMVRALLVGGIIWGVAVAMGAAGPTHAGLTVVFMVLVSMAFGLLGVVVAIVSTDFDHVQFIPSFLITPLTFLGGVFYSIEMLPAPWDEVSKLNPILYMVNGLRYGMTGVSDVPWWHGLVVLAAMIALFGGAALHLLRTGKRLRE